jgi:hypothetical protein
MLFCVFTDEPQTHPISLLLINHLHDRHSYLTLLVKYGKLTVLSTFLTAPPASSRPGEGPGSKKAPYSLAAPPFKQIPPALAAGARYCSTCSTMATLTADRHPTVHPLFRGMSFIDPSNSITQQSP